METTTPLQKIWHFFLTRIIVGIAVIVGLVAMVEWLGRSVLDRTALTDSEKNLIVAVLEASLALLGYVFLLRVYEKRPITELSAPTFIKNALIGFTTGLALQSLFILIIYVAGTYSIIHVNQVSTLISPLAFALTAGFVAEIILIGVVFRLVEDQLGTIVALAIFVLLFAVLHINSKGATVLSVCTTAIQAGFMLPAAYIFNRSLWLPIFLHFGWDLAEPGIFGGINPSTSLEQSLFTSKIAGHTLLTGGQTGPQSSIQSLILCLLTGILFLSFAKRKNHPGK